MTNMRGRALILSLACAFALGACGEKPEPDIPTHDPMDNIRQSEGWKVDQAIAVSPGRNEPTPHHVQAIASGLHKVDFKTPPKAMMPVKPSCKVGKPDVSNRKYLVIGTGRAKFPLMKKVEMTGIISFSNDTVNALGKAQVENMRENGTRKKAFRSNVSLPASTMAMKDVFITETSEPLVIALAGGGLYNFHLAPGVRLNGVVVYSSNSLYNNGSAQAAVAGVPDGVPVNFITQTHKATKGCWTRIQARPDKSWPKRMQKGTRLDALKPHWKAFFKRVKKDIGNIPEDNVISVNSAGHFLIGPPPTRYEDRIPYVAFSGKTIRFSAAENINFGTYEQNNDFARSVLDQHYKAHLKVGQ